MTKGSQRELADAGGAHLELKLADSISGWHTLAIPGVHSGRWFNFLQILRQELGEILKFGDVFGVDLHQGAMSFQTGAGYFLLSRTNRFMRVSFGWFWKRYRPLRHLEQMQNAETLQ